MQSKSSRNMVDASLYTHQPLASYAGLGWLSLAKLLVVVLVPALLLMLVWLIVRRGKRRTASRVQARQTLQSGGGGRFPQPAGASAESDLDASPIDSRGMTQ